MLLTDRQFDRTRRLALSLAGLELAERHRELLGRRSERLGIEDSSGLDSLLGGAEQGDRRATQRLLSLLTTKFTGFFRHPRQFELAAKQALRAAHDYGRARLWSAAAASGEEPYSLAMVLIEAFGRDDPPVEILATDIDAEALAVAELGQYSQTTLEGVGSERRERFLVETYAGKRWDVIPAVRRLVEFRRLNLVFPLWPVQGPFDVIFCRNVLMYLAADHRYSVLQRIGSLLAPDGLLMLDPAEHLGKAEQLFSPQPDAVYRVRCRLAEPNGEES